MGTGGKTFFTEEEQKRIEETTRAVECCTIGEVAVMVVESSDRYREAEVMGGVIFGGFLSFLMTISVFDASLWFYIPLSLILFFPGMFLYRKVPRLKASLIGRARREETVRQSAIRAFYEKGLYRTRKNTGVLFFISLLEHKVWVLADKGIYEKIDQQTLNRFAVTVSQGIKEGRACDSLCEAIRGAGDLLAKHFPVSPDDINELSDRIITE
jgi:putative membrane protein